MAKILSTSILRRPLDALIIDQGLLSREALAPLLKKAADAGKLLEDILLEDGKLAPEQVFPLIAESFNLPYTDLRDFKKTEGLGPQVLETCIKGRLLPLNLHRGLLSLATSEPGAVHQLEGPFLQMGLRVKFSVAPPKALTECLEVYRAALQEIAEPAKVGPGSEAASAGEVDGGVETKPGHDLSAFSDLNSVVHLVNKSLIDAVLQRASDIHVESTESGIRTRFRIDGVLTDRLELAGSQAMAFISRVMVMAGLDITEKMMPQDGSFKTHFQDKTVEFRIASMPGLYGQNLVLRILSGLSTEKLSLETIGFRTDERVLITSQLQFPHGMILVSGPTGSGKSTTLYALLESVADPTLKIITIEDPIERRMDRVQQIQVRMNRNDPERSLTFARGLRSILRLDPDIIMVGEIRDRETAEIAIQASLTGHLVLSTVHANSALETLRRMQNMGVDQYLLMSSMNLLIAQRLLRRLCRCKKPREITEAERRLFPYNPPPGLFDPGSCEECLGSGYRGRIGIYEFLPIDEKSREFAMKDSDISAMKQFLKRDLRTSALNYLREGVCDIPEIERVLGPCH
jgi:type IV pilus assembly protein PilB